ncbi:MAG TPA: hypothetical protein VG815_15725 [Chloroflexota bacterium]|nr:hypothetical protein [Chloroflexota bacterium]
MAEYLRFEFYIPSIFRVDVANANPPRVDVHETDPLVIEEFVRETIARFGGVTQANPAASAPFKGWWQSRRDSTRRITVDYLTYVFGLVRIDQQDEALDHFRGWKRKLEERTFQDVILVTYSPIHVLGDFF